MSKRKCSYRETYEGYEWEVAFDTAGALRAFLDDNGIMFGTKQESRERRVLKDNIISRPETLPPTNDQEARLEKVRQEQQEAANRLRADVMDAHVRETFFKAADAFDAIKARMIDRLAPLCGGMGKAELLLEAPNRDDGFQAMVVKLAMPLAYGKPRTFLWVVKNEAGWPAELIPITDRIISRGIDNKDGSEHFQCTPDVGGHGIDDLLVTIPASEVLEFTRDDLFPALVGVNGEV